jgi:hypothetical protein
MSSHKNAERASLLALLELQRQLKKFVVSKTKNTIHEGIDESRKKVRACLEKIEHEDWRVQLDATTTNIIVSKKDGELWFKYDDADGVPHRIYWGKCPRSYYFTVGFDHLKDMVDQLDKHDGEFDKKQCDFAVRVVCAFRKHDMSKELPDVRKAVEDMLTNIEKYEAAEREYRESVVAAFRKREFGDISE